MCIRKPLLVLLSISILGLGMLGVSCYKGDPGWGNTDYPPSPPPRVADAGKE